MRRKFNYGGHSLSGLVVYLFGIVVVAWVVQRAQKYVTKVRPPDESMTVFF